MSENSGVVAYPLWGWIALFIIVVIGLWIAFVVARYIWWEIAKGWREADPNRPIPAGVVKIGGHLLKPHQAFLDFAARTSDGVSAGQWMPCPRCGSRQTRYAGAATPRGMKAGALAAGLIFPILALGALAPSKEYECKECGLWWNRRELTVFARRPAEKTNNA